MIHPLLRAAADETLPVWACVDQDRRAHLARVADLMESWAVAFSLPPVSVIRWRATGMLHDALRDARPEEIRGLVDPPLRDLPGPLLHGPAAAARLRGEGVDDEAVLLAIAWHTVGHPDLDRLGRALYLADYLEPGRRYEAAVSAERRGRVMAGLDGVLREVAAERISSALHQGHPLLPPTVEFWNGMTHD